MKPEKDWARNGHYGWTAELRGNRKIETGPNGETYSLRQQTFQPWNGEYQEAPQWKQDPRWQKLHRHYQQEERRQTSQTPTH